MSARPLNDFELRSTGAAQRPTPGVTDKRALTSVGVALARKGQQASWGDVQPDAIAAVRASVALARLDEATALAVVREAFVAAKPAPSTKAKKPSQAKKPGKAASKRR